MKAISILVAAIGLVGLLIFECVAGSNWSFISNKELTLYRHVDAPISTLLVATKVEAGERLSVVRCFFDKNDAYILVSNGDGKRGYMFDNHQKFTRSWQLITLKASDIDFWQSLMCFRLVGQFGE